MISGVTRNLQHAFTEKDLFNVTDIGFIFLYSYLIQLLLCFMQIYGKTYKSSEVRAGTKLLIDGVSV